jgi:hypothetical protein
VTTIAQPTIPTAILRAAYETERAAWQADLARFQARLAAQQHIAAALGHDNAAHIAAIVRDMELIATGLTTIEELIAALPTEGAPTNGKEHAHA